MNQTIQEAAEELTQIPGYEGLYSITEKGDVFIMRERRFKAQHISQFGYFHVALYKNGARKLFKTHRLVALTFLPNPNGDKTVNHKNGIKTDNHVYNLEWCSHQQNMAHAQKNGWINRGANNHSAILNESQVMSIFNSTEKYTILAARYGVKWETIRAIKKRRTWKHLTIPDSLLNFKP